MKNDENKFLNFSFDLSILFLIFTICIGFLSKDFTLFIIYIFYTPFCNLIGIIFDFIR